MRKELNLNPKSLDKAITKGDINNTIKISCIVLSLFMILIYVVIKITSLVTIENTNNISEKLKLEGQTINENETLKKQISNMEGFLEKMNFIKDKTINTSEIFSNISPLMPQDLKFTNISLVNKEISIIGETTNYNSIAELLANLQTSKNYKTSNITSVTYNKSSNSYNFNLVIEAVSITDE